MNKTSTFTMICLLIACTVGYMLAILTACKFGYDSSPKFIGMMVVAIGCMTCIVGLTNGIMSCLFDTKK